MKLYFMRHGHAEPAQNGPDEQRALTPQGEARLERTAQVIKRLEISPAHIYSSPRVRAHQTAEIVANALGLSVEIREEMDFSFSENAVKQFISVNGKKDLMFVGHEPTLSHTIAAVTHGAPPVMKPGSLARVDIVGTSDLHGRLVWLIAPKVFDALA